MERKENANYTKLFIPLNHLHTLITHLVIFGFGLVIGITFSSYLKNPFLLIRNNYDLDQVSTPILTAITIAKIDQTNETLAQNGSLNKYFDDEELLKRALEASTTSRNLSKHVPKIAFLFLSRGSLPLAPIWERFFRGHDGLFSIYVHSNPSYNETVHNDSVFYGRSIPSKEVEWGKFNMIEAERRLLANALLEPSNQRYVLLSESCIPLFNFSTIYSYLMNSTQTFVQSYDSPGPTGRGRYSCKFRPLVTIHDWRKGSQWFEMDRDLAREVVADKIYFPRFKSKCGLGRCYVDEHYLATFVSMKFGETNSNRSLTWVDWSRRGNHPFRYMRDYVTIELLNKLRDKNDCTYNGRLTSTCFLFARKFYPNTLDRLLRFAPKVMSFEY